MISVGCTQELKSPPPSIAPELLTLTPTSAPCTSPPRDTQVSWDVVSSDAIEVTVTNLEPDADLLIRLVALATEEESRLLESRIPDAADENGIYAGQFTNLRPLAGADRNQWELQVQFPDGILSCDTIVLP